MPTPAQLTLGLRALKTIALVDGDLAPEEVSMMEAVQRTSGASSSVDALEPLSPAALAEGVVGDRLRLQLLGGMVVMTMADGEVNQAEADLVARYSLRGAHWRRPMSRRARSSWLLAQFHLGIQMAPTCRPLATSST